MTTTFLSFFPAEFLSTLPLQMLRAFAVQNPVEAAGAWAWVPAALWLIVLLGYALPPLLKSVSHLMREADGFTTVFILLALFSSFFAFPSSASKGGGTNTPPPAVAAPVKRINLYYQDATGRLVPLGARIMEDK